MVGLRSTVHHSVTATPSMEFAARRVSTIVDVAGVACVDVDGALWWRVLTEIREHTALVDLTMKVDMHVSHGWMQCSVKCTSSVFVGLSSVSDVSRMA